MYVYLCLLFDAGCVLLCYLGGVGEVSRNLSTCSYLSSG